MKFIKGLIKLVLGIVALAVVAAASLVAYLTLAEYKPGEVESVVFEPKQSGTMQPGDEIDLAIFNIGYCGLDKSQDFFMDGGKGVRPDSVNNITENLENIKTWLKGADADIYLLQEVDINSKRSYNIDQVKAIQENLDMGAAFAYNFNCKYVPFPLPTIGRVESGLLTLTHFDVETSLRISLPVPFSWPMRVANLKRCLLVTRIPVAGTESELVIVNLHLEAYDDGEGKEAQTKVLAEFLSGEYEKGNYVLAGGDFNQTFPSVPEDVYPVREGNVWKPGILSEEILPKGWNFAIDYDVPTCRLLDKPYDGTDASFYVIDGYIISPNIELISVKTVDLDFQHSDHNPVILQIKLK